VAVGTQNTITGGVVPCAIPSVAITSHGTIGVFFYCDNGIVSGFPQFTAWLGVSTNQGVNWAFTALVTFLSPAVDNSDARQRVLGDYQQLKAIDNCFYGGFVANRAAFFGSMAVDDPIFVKACYGQSASTHDLNGNGMSDILLRNTGGGIAAWLLNNNAAIQSAVAVGATTNSWVIVGQRDLNGDGVHDILFRNTDGSIAEWLMSTGGAVTSAIGLGNPTTSWDIAGTGDFNGDGIGRRSLQFFRPAHGHVEIPDQAVANRVDPAVHGKPLTACPSVENEHIRRDVANLPDDIEFAQPIQSGTAFLDGVELGPMGARGLPDGMQPVVHQPGVVHQPAAMTIHGGADAATAVMSDHDDVLHLQHVDRILKDR
jgi:hypothetical protein